MRTEPDRLGDARERGTANQMRQTPRQVAFGLVLEPAPQQVGDDEAQNAVAEEFEALVAAAGRTPAAAAAAMIRGESARMGERLFQELQPGERVADYLREVARTFCRFRCWTLHSTP